MKNKTFFYTAVLTCFWLLIICTTNAQKLPNLQKDGYPAPAKIKIDGKATEWSNTFQAYNRSTSVFYTMANDNKKLYLVIQATDPLIIRKIVNGGVTLVINTDTKNDSKSVAITYPVFEIGNRPFINLKNKLMATNDTVADRKNLNAFIDGINKEFTQKSKYIKVEGIQSIPDPLVSVYNDMDIKAAATLNNSGAYTYELGVPLNYLGIMDNSQLKINYSIKINGSISIDGNTVNKGNATEVIEVSGGAGPLSSDMSILASTTDLNGEYTLISKR